MTIASDYDPTQKVKLEKLDNQFIQSLQWKKLTDSILSNDLQAFLSHVNYSTHVDDQTVEELHPLALVTQTNAADNSSGRNPPMGLIVPAIGKPWRRNSTLYKMIWIAGMW